MGKNKKYYKWISGSIKDENGTLYYAKYKKHFWSRWRYVIDMETREPLEFPKPNKNQL